MEKLGVKISAFESKSLDLKEKVENLQNSSRHKCSPETSSSFDFFPTSGLSPVSTSATFDSFRPRAFSACTQGPSAKHLSTKLTDISSPDLGVDLESDPFSSLERGNIHRGKEFNRNVIKLGYCPNREWKESDVGHYPKRGRVLHPTPEF